MTDNQEYNDEAAITSEFPSDEYLLAIGRFVVTSHD